VSLSAIIWRKKAKNTLCVGEFIVSVEVEITALRSGPDPESVALSLGPKSALEMIKNPSPNNNDVHVHVVNS
jgi:hypothetical protein